MSRLERHTRHDNLGTDFEDAMAELGIVDDDVPELSSLPSADSPSHPGPSPLEEEAKDEPEPSCDYFGMKGVCGKKVCRASDHRCYAHRATAQKRRCAWEGCPVRCEDVEGALCSKHRRSAPKPSPEMSFPGAIAASSLPQ